MVTFSILSLLLLVKISCKYYFRKKLLDIVSIIVEKGLELEISDQFGEAMFVKNE